MNVTILGPRSVGKSTFSRVLAGKLGFEYVESDFLVHKQMEKYGGLDRVIKDEKTDLIAKVGPGIVENALNLDKIVFDLAGGVISSKRWFEMGASQKIIKTINENSVVVGLLPFEDDLKSVSFLFERERKREHFSDMDSFKLKEKVEKDYFKIKEVLGDVSDFVFYVGNENPETVAEKILKII